MIFHFGIITNLSNDTSLKTKNNSRGIKLSQNIYCLHNAFA